MAREVASACTEQGLKMVSIHYIRYVHYDIVHLSSTILNEAYRSLRLYAYACTIATSVCILSIHILHVCIQLR